MNSHVYFALTGNGFDPKLITEIIGIEPTEIWKKGDASTFNKKK